MNAKELMFLAVKACFSEGRLPNAIDAETAKSVYSLSQKHDIAHIVAAALESCAHEEVKAEFTKQKLLAVYRREQLNYEEKRICTLLEQSGIDYIPLKGSVIKRYYPEEWMRTSSDIDILVHCEDAEKAVGLICESLGYTYGGASLKDHQLYSKSGVHVELHFSVESGNVGLDKILTQIWDYAKPIDSSHRYVLTPEFLLFHTIAHAQYHFAAGGCGVKPFIDLWMLDSGLKYDDSCLKTLIAESGSERFFDAFYALMCVWFKDGKHTALTEKMEDYILDGGVYGTRENLGSASAHREGGRAKYLLARIFKPKKALEAQYPNLKQHPILLPYYQVKRWFNLLDRDKRALAEKELSGSMENNGIAEMLKELGL